MVLKHQIEIPIQSENLPICGVDQILSCYILSRLLSRECSKEVPHPSHPWDAALAACHIQLLQRFVAILLAVLHAGDEGSDDHSCHSGSL